MVRQLYYAHLSFLINSCASEWSAQNKCSVGWIEAEVTVKLFRCLLTAIRLVRLRPFRKPYRLCLPYERADQAVNEWGRGVRCRLLMVRILQFADVSGILYQSMLEAASGADKGSSLLSGKVNPAQGSFHAHVRTAWSCP
jgi:hypothetical protein